MDINFQKKTGEMISIGSGIAESGNGYIRFNDGTQICYGSATKVFNDDVITCAKPFLKDDDTCVTFSYSTQYIRDINRIYMFNVAGYGGNGGIHISINFIEKIITKNATADLGGHSHKIEATVSEFNRGTVSVEGSSTLTNGINLHYIAIGRWK